jgi:hypothetical protein
MHIDLWYGNRQRFGHRFLPQRWVNVLGRVEDMPSGACLEYRLNGAPPRRLSLGPDGHRLARRGDFNVELDAADLRPGANNVLLQADAPDGQNCRCEVTLVWEEGRTPMPPLRIQWDRVSAIQDVAQVVDGRWALTPAGVRVCEPWYDRVIAVGDRSWRDYEIATAVTFHGLHQPNAQLGDGGAGVIHAALALRWPGHDIDDRQPHVKWYPLGATAEFRVNPRWRDCSWRILGGAGVRVESKHARGIEPGARYGMKARVVTLADGGARYSAKLWPADGLEPSAWDIEMDRPSGGVASGGALLVAHYTDVTFGDVEVLSATNADEGETRADRF